MTQQSVAPQKLFWDLHISDDCNENLQFAEEVVASSDIPEQIKSNLYKNIQHIRQRYLDPNLYLAILGEFSSGKSTFINALLRDNLLKTSALPTTAAATHLYYGKAVTVEVTLKAPRSGTIKTKPDSRQITVPWLPGIKNLDNRQFIHAVTVQGEIAENVTCLKITHPSLFLRSQVVIIDTPGINANEQHGAITQQVVEKAADAAIIIIPATVPLSQTLVNFLSTSLALFIHRCIFIVTRMDQIREKERGKLIRNLRTRLREQLGIESPLIYSCSAQVVMDIITGEQSVPNDLLSWKDRFTDLEGIILERLQHERVISISASILRLLSLLFEQLNSHLRFQWEHHQVTQISIQNQVIPDLASFISEQHATCNQMLEDTTLAIRLQADKFIQQSKDNTFSELKSTIFSVESEAALKSVIQTGVQDLLDKKQKHLRQDLQGKFGNFAKAVTEANLFFDENFSAAYCRLQVLSSSVKFNSGFRKNDLKVDINEVLSATQTLQQELDDKAGNVAFGGMAGGVAIGSFILPGIGTVVGGILGAMLSGFFMPSLEKRKEKLWEKLYPSLNDYFNEVKSQVQKVVEAYKKDAMSSIDKRIDEYATSYKSAVDELLAEQATELRRLSNLQESIQTNLLEIEKRQKLLTKAQEQWLLMDSKDLEQRGQARGYNASLD